MKRSSGILMPIFSLPSPYGIGTMGKAAYDFVDFLKAAGQSWWQILPVGPTSYGDSPYQSFSTFAGNPYFIDLDALIKEKLLTKKEIEAVDWGENEEKVDYERIYLSRFDILHKAKDRGYERDREKIKAFEEENKDWLFDYALFMALKRHFGMKSWIEWEDEDIRLRRPKALEKYTALLKEDIEFFVYIQYLFFSQWEKLKAYAKENGIGIIGDLPIYVAMDSADVWANPRFFKLDEKNMPREVAGVPPDYFTEDGQLWGNPLYDWDAMHKDGYGWWIRRVGGARKLYDVLRIDHFRGFESYWAVPYGEKTAKIGRWVKGPGIYFVNIITVWFDDMQFIAEDLGCLTPEVHELLKESGLPGMKVLEFAFDPINPSDYLPHNYDRNCVCYAGTHDNTTLAAWKTEADRKEVKFAEKYLGLNDKEGFVQGILRGGMSSAADLFVTQMQDYLGLGAEARINTPGILGGNWQWRMKKGAATKDLAKKIAYMTKIYGRSCEN
ncbi:MAG: 4-alpha-glucanotransferase [Acutalibacteraceae bacterium]